MQFWAPQDGGVAEDVAFLKLNTLYRDVAQMVARLLWEQDVAGSNPVIPTKQESTLGVLFLFALAMIVDLFCA